jgi:hypothetical protein
VRTRGYGGARGEADRGRSWLLIKHRDDWSGALDIAEFAPRSVKTERDFAEILAENDPDLWQSGRPARSGATGAMLQSIVEDAARLQAGRRQAPRRPPKRATRARPSNRKKS